MSASVIRFLEIILSKLEKWDISLFYLASVAEKAGFCMA